MAGIQVTKLVDVIPKLEDEKPLEHLISIVDKLEPQINEDSKEMFLIIVESRRVLKSIHVIKGNHF